MRDAGGRTSERPDDEGQDRNGDDRRNEIARDTIGEPLDRGARPLRVADHAHNLREQRVAADALGAHGYAAVDRNRGTDDAIAWRLVHRHRLAGHHRLVHRRLPVDDDAVHGNLVARPDAQEITGADLVERNILLAAAVHPPRGLRRETEELPDRRSRLVARPKLQHLAEQHQHHDDDRRVEVRVHAAGDDNHRAVDIGCADPHADQREHVGAGVDDRVPHPLKERPAAPEHDRRCQHEAEPVHRGHADAVAQRAAAHHVAHREEKHRRAQHDADPEPAGHVHELWIRCVGQIGDAGFERHAAFRAGAWTIRDDLGVHRAHPLSAGIGAGIRAGIGAGRGALGWPLLQTADRQHLRRVHRLARAREVFLRVGLELGDAALRAEIVRRAVVDDGARGAVGIHRHPADGIDSHEVSDRTTVVRPS